MNRLITTINIYLSLVITFICEISKLGFGKFQDRNFCLNQSL